MSYQQSYQQVINNGELIKKEIQKMRNSPLQPPYRVKETKKEHHRLPIGNYWHHRARTPDRVREYMRERGWNRRRLYDEAGAAADQIIANCFGTIEDHNHWAAVMYQYPWAIGTILDTAYEKASRFRCKELKNPVTSFQSWLNKNYPDMRSRRPRNDR